MIRIVASVLLISIFFLPLSEKGTVRMLQIRFCSSAYH